MARRVKIECGKFPTGKGCSLTLAGTEEEVLGIAVQHAVQSHGQTDTPEFRQQLRSAMQEDRG